MVEPLDLAAIRALCKTDPVRHLTDRITGERFYAREPVQHLVQHALALCDEIERLRKDNWYWQDTTLSMQTERDAMRPVVEAAVAWVKMVELERGVWRTAEGQILRDAVAAYRAAQDGERQVSPRRIAGDE